MKCSNYHPVSGFGGFAYSEYGPIPAHLEHRRLAGRRGAACAVHHASAMAAVHAPAWELPAGALYEDSACMTAEAEEDLSVQDRPFADWDFAMGRGCSPRVGRVGQAGNSATYPQRS